MKEEVEEESIPSKEKIQEAAIELCAQKGYAGATTAAIAKLAVGNEVTIFRIFGYKNALFYDVYLRMTPMVEVMNLDGLTDGKDIRKDLTTFFKNYGVAKTSTRPLPTALAIFDLSTTTLSSCFAPTGISIAYFLSSFLPE